ncbi:SDR family NAD(P)-dependent oxidoreductase [Nonomuraea recticatena]|uniref:SDR family NAD(P)-dependent oxidoreductase n=1 Tax=Nonomuraea recticatena TaxID=46178 RepID=UPI003618A404
MDLQLTGKTAVVTGGSKGIGLALVRTLLAEGMRVVTGSRTITAELKETGAVPVTVDLSTAEGPARLIDSAIDELGGIDLLVNNVGVGDTDDFAKGSGSTCWSCRMTPGSTPSTCTSTARCGSAAPRFPA